MKKQNGFTLIELLFVPLAITCIAGWIMNIMAIAGSDFTIITGMLILRIIGVFMAPLGVVMGLFF